MPDALDAALVTELLALLAEELAPLVAEASLLAVEDADADAELDAATDATELPAIAEEKSASTADLAALA